MIHPMKSIMANAAKPRRIAFLLMACRLRKFLPCFSIKSSIAPWPKILRPARAARMAASRFSLAPARNSS